MSVLSDAFDSKSMFVHVYHQMLSEVVIYRSMLLHGSAAKFDLHFQIDRAKNKFTSSNGLDFMAPEMTTIPAGIEPTGVVDMFCMGILILYVSVDLLIC